MLTDDTGLDAAVWRDPSRDPVDRVEDLLARMTLAEKVAQLYGVWIGADPTDSGEVAPFQHELIDPLDWDRLLPLGLGQITRPFGTAPIDAAVGARQLAVIQAEVVAAGRFGIPAVAHEECLNGFTSLGATIFPSPLAWGAAFDPALVERMATMIGETMRGLGIHQGLAPVLDVTRDPRWGRTEETIGEDPYLVATVGTAYVRGLETAGIIATLKHFAGYSGSRAGRNFGPVGVGPREFADVFLPPFELAVRDGGARSVMHSYAELDGVPAAAHEGLLTGILRDTWGFTGTVVADYFGVTFLHNSHHVAADRGDAARLALRAGVDVELPTVQCFGAPLLAALDAGAVDEALIDRAARRVLRQKCELGLLDPQWTPTATTAERIDLDPPAGRALARQLAEASVVLLANDGTLPLRPDATVAVTGPFADDPHAMLGCYTFPRHVGIHHEGTPIGVEIPTLLDALRAELPQVTTTAWSADVRVVVLGDHSGLFGAGTSGEGSDAADLRLPGDQERVLLDALADGTPTVLVLLSGRPYALGAYADRLAAIVQAYFPGEEGGPAVAGVLSGRVNPSGRSPVSVPRTPGGQPYTYLAPALAHASPVSTVDPTPLFPFGHGLSYTSFAWDDVELSSPTCPTDGEVTLSVRVRNTGARAGSEVVQLYLHDPVAQVTRPVTRLIGYAKVALAPQEAVTVAFTVHADLSSFTGLAGHRVVEPGELELRLCASSSEVRHTVRLDLTGEERTVDHTRRMTTPVAYSAAA
ncbi:beta-xylosidase [Allocatelliglobosispora scoriae]|uniref:Beta-xylosidase n=1 Tax=Allocatelliglobosispora scoriae TaxID=643052 RepID=A0A841BGQ6_9ACTN|nr:glycoside hydrolase family 3 N-terminal domain-containing protein [Allocatelliglobosispora scoriae]MBB5868267.1 beta-xylosidase [Allocatelliglobosispora scoriae]